MSDFHVVRYGTDSSGRGVFLTVYMHDWWEHVVELLGFQPTIVQGAFMTRNGGGARASSGAHDQGGCIDLRTRDLTGAQIDRLVRTCREQGAAAWRRDPTPRHGGMDPHCHITLGTDRPLSPMARTSWESYVGGGDGLAGPGSDYEWRPSPLVKAPPEEDDDMGYLAWSKDDKAALLNDIFHRKVNRDEPNGGTYFDAAIGNMLDAVKDLRTEVAELRKDVRTSKGA